MEFIFVSFINFPPARLPSIHKDYYVIKFLQSFKSSRNWHKRHFALHNTIILEEIWNAPKLFQEENCLNLYNVIVCQHHIKMFLILEPKIFLPKIVFIGSESPCGPVALQYILIKWRYETMTKLKSTETLVQIQSNKVTVKFGALQIFLFISPKLSSNVCKRRDGIVTSVD